MDAKAQKLTPSQKLKLAEAEILQLKQLLFKQTEQHAQELGNRIAEEANKTYTLGYEEGFRDATNICAAQKADAGISRFFRK